MKKDVYIYPSIFDYDEDGITVTFPDLPGCITCGESTEEAIQSAKECMALHLYGMEEDNDLIPEPSKVEELKTEEKQALMLIEVYMPLYREAIENKAVKKTLTIPQWLNSLAEEQKVNFSQVLQNALKERLNIKRTKEL